MTGSNPVPGLHHGHHRHHAHGAHGAHDRGTHHGGAFHTLVNKAALTHAYAEIPKDVSAALRAAMVKEGVPASWEHPLLFIMGRESKGQVDAYNPTDSARGLFQLTQASYHHNPSGTASFGNAVEEAQGGIRYIQSRYQSADHAVKFWQAHGWY